MMGNLSGPMLLLLLGLGFIVVVGGIAAIIIVVMLTSSPPLRKGLPPLRYRVNVYAGVCKTVGQGLGALAEWRGCDAVRRSRSR